MDKKIDLHIHSKYSKDSHSEPGEILKTARVEGLSGVAVVDHGTIEGGMATIKENTDPEFIVIVGAEIKTDRGEIIGYFLNDEIRSNRFLEVVDEMRGQDALISIPHPFDHFRLNRVKDPSMAVERVDAVEVFNSRCMLDSFNKKALELSKKHDLAATAGSDAHHSSEIGSAGVSIKGDRIRDEIMNNRNFFGSKNTLFLHARARFDRLFTK